MNRLKRRRRRLALVGLLLLMIGSVVLLQLRIAPTLRRIAENQVVNAASDAIFRAVARQLQTGSVDYSRIIGLEKDETGRIAALTTDMQQVAKLKSEVLAFLDEEISNMDDEALSVPVGSLLFPTFFAGRGFPFPCACLPSTVRTPIFTAASSLSASTRACSRFALPLPSACPF